MNKEIREKIKILKELGCRLSKADINRLKSAISEIQLDRIAHEFIMR